MKNPDKTRKVKEAVLTIAVSILFALGVKSTAAEARFIASGSMLPTLKINDRLVVEKLSPHFTIPARGQIVLFAPPHIDIAKLSFIEKTKTWTGFSEYIPYIKRVIALPGETVEVKRGQVFINGEVLSEDYVMEPPFYELAPITIPAGEVFVLGDNRNNSGDSHVWGTLPMNKILGKAVFRLWPLERIGFVD